MPTLAAGLDRAGIGIDPEGNGLVAAMAAPDGLSNRASTSTSARTAMTDEAFAEIVPALSIGALAG